MENLFWVGPINTSKSVLEKITEHSLILEINYSSFN